MKPHHDNAIICDQWVLLLKALKKGWKAAGTDPIIIVYPEEFHADVMIEVALHPFANPTKKQMQLMPIGGGCQFLFMEDDKVKVTMQISDPTLVTRSPFINHFLSYRGAVQNWNGQLPWEVDERKQRCCYVSWKEAYFIIKEIGDAIQKDMLIFPSRLLKANN